MGLSVSVSQTATLPLSPPHASSHGEEGEKFIEKIAPMAISLLVMSDGLYESLCPSFIDHIFTDLSWLAVAKQCLTCALNESDVHGAV